MRTLLPPAVFALVTVASARAEANHDSLDLVVSPGITFSFGLGEPRPVWGVGLECSVMDARLPGYSGGVAQAQYLSDGSFRFAVAAQASLILGLELGLALRTATATRPVTVAARVSPHVALGYTYVAYDLNILLNPSERMRALDHFMHVGLKVPFFRYERGFQPYPEIYLGGGRPLRHEGAPCLAPLRRDDVSWVAAPTPADVVSAADDATRARLARAWARDARLEHASVAAFARLSLELLALGAPPDLVRGAHEAALDEIDHAARCLALASAYAGAALSPGPLPEATTARRADLVTLAAEALVEGCVGEGIAAAQALAASRDAAGPAQDTLARIAEDEARHAELAWRVLAWCRREGGAAVDDALAAALRALPATGGGDEPALDPRHGRLDAGRARAIARHVVRRVTRRLALPRGEAAPPGPRREGQAAA